MGRWAAPPVAPALLGFRDMGWLPLTALISFCAASTALGADLGPLRQSAAQSSQEVVQLKSRQSELRGRLDALAARIGVLKAEQQRNILPGSELTAALRRSQDLSRQLSDVARSVSEAEARAQQRNLSLISGLSDELARLGAAWDESESRDTRNALVVRMRGLRAEREQVRALLPSTAVPLPDSLHPSDDAGDLIEQANALRDSEDKVRQQVRVLDLRIAEARQERDLDRRMKEFLSDESTFDEQDRRFRLRGGPEGEGAQFGRPEGAARTGEPGPAGADSPAITPAGDRGSGKPPRPEDGRRLISAGAAADDVEALEGQRERLRSLAESLDAKARQVESRARQLR